MNIKVVLNKKVHKLPQESCQNLEGVLKALHLIFKEKLPKSFQIQYKIDKDSEFSSIQSEQEFQKLIQTQKQLKFYIVKKEVSEQEQQQQQQQQVTKQGEEDDKDDEEKYFLMTSTIKKEAEQEENVKTAIQQEQEQTGQLFMMDESICPVQNPQIPINNQDQEEEKEEFHAQDQINPDDFISEDPIYGCIDCQSDDKNCKRCNGKGFLTNNDNIIKLINQIVDHKLQRIISAQQMESDFPEIHDNFACNMCKTTPIIGTRYQCSKNKNFNICQVCEKTSQHPYDFVKIKRAKYNQKVVQKPKQNVKQQLPTQDNKQKNNLGGQIKNFFKNLIPDQIPQEQEASIKKPKKLSNDIVAEKKEVKQEQKQEEKKIKKTNYKASFVENPKSEILTKIGEPYKWSVTLKNSGDQQWPETVRLHCVQGQYYGFAEKVQNIFPQESHQIDLNLNSLNQEQALQCNGKQMISWRLGYIDENQNIQYFGPKIMYEINIKQDQSNNENINKTGISCQEANPAILSQNKEVLEKAEKLKEIFKGEVKQYVDFIQQSNLSESSVEELIEIYFQQQQH